MSAPDDWMIWIRDRVPGACRASLRRHLLHMHIHVPGAKLGLVVAGPERSRVQELAPIHWRATCVLRIVVVIGEGQEMRVGERRAHGFLDLITG